MKRQILAANLRPQAPISVKKTLVILGLWALSLPAHATSVIAPSFRELVAESVAVVEAQVIDVKSVEAGSTIKTLVTFKVSKVLKGRTDAEITLSFLGGDLGGRSMRVEGMPTFKVGQAEFLFISDQRGVQFCPLVGMMHGRYGVRSDSATGRKHIRKDNGEPLTGVSDVQMQKHHEGFVSAMSSHALSPESFEQLIENEVKNSAASK